MQHSFAHAWIITKVILQHSCIRMNMCSVCFWLDNSVYSFFSIREQSLSSKLDMQTQIKGKFSHGGTKQMLNTGVRMCFCPQSLLQTLLEYHLTVNPLLGPGIVL